MSSFVPLRLLVPWPEHLFPSAIEGAPSGSFLDLVGVSSFTSRRTTTARELAVEVAALREVAIGFAPLPGFALVLGTDDGMTSLSATLTIADTAWLRLDQLSFRLRFPSSLFAPVRLENGEYVQDRDENGDLRPYEIAIENVAVTVDGSGNVDLENAPTISLEPVMIGDSGIVIDAEAIELYLSAEAELPGGVPEDFQGIFLASARIYLPRGLSSGFPPELSFENCYIGAGGFTGTVQVPELQGAGSVNFAGLSFSPRSISLSFSQNAIVDGTVTGQLTVPFFDEVVSVALGLGVDGGFCLTLTDLDENGIVSLTKAGVGTLKLTSLGLVLDEEGTTLLLSGSLQLEIGSPALQWPGVAIQNLRISPDGQVQIPGGWLDLQEPISLDLYGFRVEISQIGFGNQADGRRWLGFSGGLQLVDLLPSGVSVEGLRVRWNPTGDPKPELTLQGVGLELLIPGVLSLDGDVALIQESDQNFFKGNAKLELLPLGMSLDASIKIGHDPAADDNFAYTFLNLELPIGIPLWATGAALYGVSGLYGLNVLPNATTGDWYGWYAGPPEQFNVTSADKWAAAQDGRAFGAGMVLGTLFDAGHVVSTKALFALVLPGPVILFNGKANLLQVPPSLTDSTSEGVFDLLAVLDANAGDLQLNIDAGWSLSQVIDVSASAEAYFDFANPRNWHLYLGQDRPEDRRIRAYVISLFHADAYVMIDSNGIAAGCGVTWGQNWKFGPVKVILQSSIEAGATITWQPPQLGGHLDLDGEFEVSVAGFGAGLGVEASLAGKTPTPYWVHGELTVRVKLPPPLTDLEEDIRLEWRQDQDPPNEDPFQSMGVEHPKVDETWMPRDFSEESDPNRLLNPSDGAYVPGPIVPLDGRPAIALDRAVRDLVSDVDLINVGVYPGGTQIGDYTFDYEVRDLALDKWSKAGGTHWEPVENLYGSWMAVEDGSGKPAASKLQIWARTPFEFTRQSSRTYRDAFLSNHVTWPCAEAPEPVVSCIDWEDENVETRFGAAFARNGVNFIIAPAGAESPGVVVPLNLPRCATTRALRISGDSSWIVFSEPVRNVALCVKGIVPSVSAYGNGVRLERLENATDVISLTSGDIDALHLEHADFFSLAKVCYETEAAAGLRESTQEYLDHTIAGLTHWASEDQILEPETWYRLTVDLNTVRTHKGDEFRTSYKHIAYFHTVGPPGLIPSWVTPPVDSEENVPSIPGSLSEQPYPYGGKLTDLNTYVTWSIPENGAVPVYRAYDFGVEFNENYVEQLYGADMMIQLLDNNDSPVRDQEGQEVAFLNQWAENPTVELTETELPYVTRVADCTNLATTALAPNQRVLASYGILLDEDFSGDLERWTDPDEPAGHPTKRWAIGEGMLICLGTILPVRGALLVTGEDGWTDYAVEVALSHTGDDLGLVFRYTKAEAETYYRLRLSKQGRRLDRISAGVTTALWEDSSSYTPGAAATLAIQCQGHRLRGQVDRELLFDLSDAAGPVSGKAGIYSNSRAAFASFFVREWPGGILAPDTMYSAQLMASFVLFQGGLAGGWTDSANDAWTEWARDNTHLASIGRGEWDNYRVEVTVVHHNQSFGAIARLQAHNGQFTCYRFLVDPDGQSLHLARLEGTYSGSSYHVPDGGRTVLWSATGSDCGIDFSLDEQNLALTCDGTTIIVELNGQELAAVEDSLLEKGQVGLYYGGSERPEFSELIIRSAARQPVYQWSFITSAYAGLVELMDTFAGHVQLERASRVDLQQLAAAMRGAIDGIGATTAQLEAARRSLEGAPIEEVAPRKLAVQRAVADRNEASTRHFAALDELLLQSRYRPTPPSVEITEIVDQRHRYALLFESPEPLDWSRLTARLSCLSKQTHQWEDVEGTIMTWNNDGTKAFLIGTTSLGAGRYRLHFDYRLDVGGASPVLHRGGSTLPEVAALVFTLS